MGRTTWLWNQPGNSNELRQGVAGGDWIIVSGAASAGASGLVKAEWKKSESNQRAKFYKITRLGKEQLASDYERWGRMVATIEGIMTAK
jgi:uncharacterized protein YodC (DUF2158 family)